MSGIIENLKAVEKLFMEAESWCEESASMDDLILRIENVEPNYRSIAYESASMFFAFKSLSEGAELAKWRNFYGLADRAHRFHMLIGLGWGMARAGTGPQSWMGLSEHEEELACDGMGYYYALFKGRDTLKQQIVPDILKDNIASFDRGVGRRLWYHAMGDPEKLQQFMDSFDHERKEALWKGVGIALAYVQADDHGVLMQVKEMANDHLESFLSGVALGVNSRLEASCADEDTEWICRNLLSSDLRSLDYLHNFD